MNGRLCTLLGMSALCVTFAMGSAEARESRTANFSFTCDGLNQHVLLTVGGLGASTTRFIEGAAIALFQNSGGLQYIVFTANDANKVLLNMGIGLNNQITQYTASLIPVTTTAAGQFTFTIDGACNPGTGQIQGNAIVWFFT